MRLSSLPTDAAMSVGNIKELRSRKYKMQSKEVRPLAKLSKTTTVAGESSLAGSVLCIESEEEEETFEYNLNLTECTPEERPQQVTPTRSPGKATSKTRN